MKQILLLLGLLISTAAHAQNEKVFEDHGVSGYGGPVFRYTTVDGKGALMMGNFSGAKMGDHLVIGGGGYTLIASFDSTQEITIGYGGFGIAYTNTIGHDLFYAGELLLGSGGVRAMGEGSGVFIAEATLVVGFELLPFFRLGLGGGYRVAAGLDLPGYTSSDLNGAAAELHIIFGKFY